MNPFQTSSNTYLIAKQMASSPNDEQTKRGAEEPGLLLHNNTYYSLVMVNLFYWFHLLLYFWVAQSKILVFEMFGVSGPGILCKR